MEGRRRRRKEGRKEGRTTDCVRDMWIRSAQTRKERKQTYRSHLIYSRHADKLRKQIDQESEVRPRIERGSRRDVQEFHSCCPAYRKNAPESMLYKLVGVLRDGAGRISMWHDGGNVQGPESSLDAGYKYQEYG